VSKTKTATAALLLLVAGGVAAATATPASAPKTAARATSCAFELRIGDVLPFTGDLAAYGANLDRAVKLAVDLQNASLQKAGVGSQISVKLVASEDGQTQASASVEAATKLVKSDKAQVIIGEMASSATIPMAQSVTIRNKIVQISPTSSAPQISTIKDDGYLWRTYPSDALQGKVLAQAAVTAFGKGATLNVGARNDAFGTALRQLFVAQWKKLGGKVGVDIAWNPEQANFDSEAQKLAGGSPAGWVIIDFPDTFQKFLPSLVRTGEWSAKKTLMTEALRNGDVLSKLGDPVIGLRGTAASAAGGPAGKAFAALWKAKVKGAKPYTGFEGTAFDAANVAFLAALKGCSSSPAKIKSNLRAVSGPPGAKVTFQSMTGAIKLLLAHRDVDYEGAFSPVDFDANGDIGSAVFEIWRYDGGGKISTLRTVTFRG
jgi:ABC-type branched-subunit amino acid transport system substrate-binding protein